MTAYLCVIILGHAFTVMFVQLQVVLLDSRKMI